MALTPGTRVGIYEVAAALGEGGMGQVYLAIDTTLGRQVAIKVLPETFASDPDRLARFEREARTLASLNHPHIAAIYGFERNSGVHALVMELVEGQDLSQRIAGGAIPLGDALSIARQIGHALDAAHEQGIVHRDLKPANIRVRPDGTVKVLDFGLAKGKEPAGVTADASHSPTVMSPVMTHAGVILGTAAYMSPEQARGKIVDRRADIWAFGCVLYEMLTGRRAFAGDTLSDTIAAILEREPDWKALPVSVPPRVRRLLTRCLEKDPKRRLRDIGDAHQELDEVTPEELASRPPGPPPPSRVREYAGWVAAAVVVSAAVLLMQRSDRPPVRHPVIRTAIVLPASHTLVSESGSYSMAISSDGARLAFVAEFEGRSQLYVQELSELEPKAIAGTSGAAHPFFSPDGQWVGFLAGGELQKVPVSGGSPLRICTVPGASRGATWGPDNTIVLSLLGSGLSKVSASGGTLEPIPGSGRASWPEFLPDGKTVLYTTGAGSGDAFVATSIDGRTRKIVARTTDAAGDGPAVLGTGGGLAQARFVSSGYLVYGQGPGMVRALPFDVASLTPTGSPVPLVDSIERAPNAGAVYFAASRTGLVVAASTGDRHELVWVDRTGIATPISADREAFRGPRLSPDGRRIAVMINDETRRSDIWIYDAERGTKSRLTTTGHNLAPLWTPDGTHITFSNSGLVQSPVDGGETQETLLPLDQVRAHLAAGTNAYPTAWSPDGRNLVFQADQADLWELPRGGTGVPRPLLVRPANDYGGIFSRDGRWLAYVSNESGRREVYVGSYPDLGSKVTISTEGGAFPRWSRDGRELFYRQGDALMAVTVDTSIGFRAGKPQRLFAGPYTGTGRESSFDVAPDGKRFVMVRSDKASTLRQLTVVQNWFEDSLSGELVLR